MKAWVATGKPGEPLVLAEVPDPAQGAGEVLVAVDAYSVNRGEMFFLNGVYGTPAQAGWRPGQDIAGTVLQAAADGSGPLPGTRVVGHPQGAGWAERAVVPVSRLAELPDELPGAVAARPGRTSRHPEETHREPCPSPNRSFSKRTYRVSILKV